MLDPVVTPPKSETALFPIAALGFMVVSVTKRNGVEAVIPSDSKSENGTKKS